MKNFKSLVAFGLILSSLVAFVACGSKSSNNNAATQCYPNTGYGTTGYGAQGYPTQAYGNQGYGTNYATNTSVAGCAGTYGTQGYGGYGTQGYGGGYAGGYGGVQSGSFGGGFSGSGYGYGNQGYGGQSIHCEGEFIDAYGNAGYCGMQTMVPYCRGYQMKTPQGQPVYCAY